MERPFLLQRSSDRAQATRLDAVTLRRVVAATAWLVVLVGGFLVVIGALHARRGDASDLLAGIALIVSGAWIGRYDPRGRALCLILWAGTVLRVVAEVGPSPSRLVPRLLAPTVLLALVFLPTLIGARRRADPLATGRPGSVKDGGTPPR